MSSLYDGHTTKFRKMKKYILSTLVILTFGTYVLFQKITGTDNTITVKNNKNTNNISTTVNTQVVIPAVAPAKITNPAPVITPSKIVNAGLYKDGEYTGTSADAYYGNIQVKAIISGGKLTDVQFLDHPQDRNTSIRINDYAMPILRSEAIQAQSANINTISGATDSSGAFKQSLQSALSQAKNS